MRTIRLRSAVAIVIFALLFQYLLLRGPEIILSYGSFIKYHHVKEVLANGYKPHQYRMADYVVALELPEDTEVHCTPDQGEEMKFNIYFVNKSLAFRGYIQVWRVEDLQSFLEQSKSLSPFDFISYHMQHLQGNSQGFKTEWSADFGESVVSGLEYWWSLDSNEVVRLSFFTDTREIPKELADVSDHIRRSLGVNSQQII